MSFLLIQQNIQAAGRTLSQKNASRLKIAFREITSILIEAGLVDADTIQDLMEDSVEEAAESSTEPSEVAVAAESFPQQVNRVTWHDRLRSTIKIFIKRFSDIHNLSDAEYEDEYGNDETRQQAMDSIVSDLSTILAQLGQQHPGQAENWRDRWNGYDAPYSPFMLSAESGDAKPVNYVKLAIQCDAVVSNVAAKRSRNKESGKNRVPVTGVLFRIDEPSEAVPAKGPGLPLYIPAEVAASIVNTVTGLPLDAHDNLSQHAEEEITGAMLSAEVQGKDFVVHGVLWPASKTSKVKKIAANAEKLGMSMTADAWGHEAEVDGNKVFWVDDLDLSGANILFSDCATYQKTRLLMAERRDPTAELPTAIAANSTTIIPQEQIGMDPELKQQLALIQSSLASVGQLTQTVTSHSEAIAQIQQTLTPIAASVQAIDAERCAQQEAANATAQQKAAQETMQSVVAAALANINTQVQEAVTTAVKAAINPSRQPARLTTPLLANAAQQGQAATVSSEAMAIQLELAKLDGQLTGARGLAAQTAILDQRRALEMQLHALQV
jgi:hypothetical protein